MRQNGMVWTVDTGRMHGIGFLGQASKKIFYHLTHSRDIMWEKQHPCSNQRKTKLEGRSPADHILLKNFLS